MLIKEYGSLWARNSENIKSVRKLLGRDTTGIYVLFNGSTPVYVGKGHIRSRISSHNRSTKRAFWDHFSWFVIGNKKTEHDLEALLVTTLPFYLRIYTRQDAKFLHGKSRKQAKQETFLRMPKHISRFHRPKLKRKK